MIAFGHLTGELRYIDAAKRTVRLFAPALAESPGGYSSLLGAVAALEAPPALVLLQGDVETCAQWQRTLENVYRPAAHVFNLAAVAALPPALMKGVVPTEGAVAWVCRGMACLPPITTPEALAGALR